MVKKLGGMYRNIRGWTHTLGLPKRLRPLWLATRTVI